MRDCPYIPLRNHTAFSLSEGALKIPDLVDRCYEWGMPAVAMTDTGNLFGAMEFSLTCQKKGIQPIIGCTLALLDPTIHGEDGFHGANGHGHLPTVVVYAQNHEGYQNLIKLVSDSHLRQDRRHGPHVTWDELAGRSKGLILLTGGALGPIHTLLAGKNLAGAKIYLNRMKTVFGDRLYGEISRQDATPASIEQEDQLIALAYDLDVPLVATNQAFFLDPDFYEAHDALLCVAQGCHVQEENRRRVTRDHHLQSPAAMDQRFKDLPEAIHNTQVIAQRCAFMVEPCEPVLPSFPCEQSEEKELEDQAFRGLNQRLENQVLPLLTKDKEKEAQRKLYEDRLIYELEIIKKMGFAGYYLIVADFIQWAKMQNIPVGPGRGSGAGSLVAWSLTITDIDPMRFGLLFERFLNPERVSMPDFDVDFCQDRRDEVIDYVRGRYGADKVAQIITFGKLQAKAVVRDVGRVLGMPYGYVDKISKLIPNNPANPIALGDAIAQEPKLQEMAEDDPQVQKLLTMGQQLEGLYRHASTHAAGVVIGRQSLDSLVPLYHDGESPLPATQFHMKHVEMAGLVKFDFLGLKTLTVIQKTVDLLKEQGIPVDMARIPLDDPKTFELLQRVEAVGIFQLESAGMRDVMGRLQPQRFEEIIALVALYRPGPMDDIPRYLACKHGQEAVRFDHPLLEPILKETFGVMVYQEQVMEIARVLSGYSLGEADLLRRAMGKKIKAEMDAQSQKFIQGAIEKGVDAKTAQRVFDQAAKFAGYGFNKCHSAPYALIAYQTAYLKANHPVAFMAASMTCDLHNTDKLTLFWQDLNRMGIPLLAPDINRSHDAFTVEALEKDHPSGMSHGVRYALSAIKGVGIQAVQMVVKEREAGGPFTSFFHFARRLDSKVVNRRMLEKLVAAGAFDTLHPDRGTLMEAIPQALIQMKAAQKQMASKQGGLFSQEQGSQEEVCFPDKPLWGRLLTLEHEFNALGFYFSCHPLDVYQDQLKKMSLAKASDLMTLFSQEQEETARLAGVVLGKKERLSKKGSRYAFVQFSDSTGCYEVTFFSELYKKLAADLEPGQMFYVMVAGKLEGEALRLTAREAEPLDQRLHKNRSQVTLVLDQKTDLRGLRDFVEGLPAGEISLYLHLMSHPYETIVRLDKKVSLNPSSEEMLMTFSIPKTQNHPPLQEIAS